MNQPPPKPASPPAYSFQLTDYDLRLRAEKKNMIKRTQKSALALSKTRFPPENEPKANPPQPVIEPKRTHAKGGKSRAEKGTFYFLSFDRDRPPGRMDDSRLLWLAVCPGSTLRSCGKRHAESSATRGFGLCPVVCPVRAPGDAARGTRPRRCLEQ